MSYRITFNQPFPFKVTEEKLSAMKAKFFDYGCSKFFAYDEKYFEIEQDQQKNIIGLKIHGNNISDFKTLLNVKNKIFFE
jgi:hypothetical protein